MLCKARVTSRVIPLNGGLSILKTANHRRTRRAMEFHRLAQKYLRNRDAETDWLLESWSFVLEALDKNPQSLIGGVDWITKRWLLETFMESEN